MVVSASDYRAVSIAEETGWRRLLQPELDKRMAYPFSFFLTAAIWFVWHFPVFIDPTSSHYGDSIIGFGITIYIWAFALAAIMKSTFPMPEKLFRKNVRR